MSKEEKLNKVNEKQALDTIAKQDAKEKAEEHDHEHDHKAHAKKEAKTEEVAKPAKREIVANKAYTVSLLKAYRKPAPKRANTAIKMLRAYVARHCKVKEDNVKIDGKVHNFIHARGHTKPAKSVKIKVAVDKQGTAQVELA